jgi:hypothetical protein
MADSVSNGLGPYFSEVLAMPQKIAKYYMSGVVSYADIVPRR